MGLYNSTKQCSANSFMAKTHTAHSRFDRGLAVLYCVLAVMAILSACSPHSSINDKDDKTSSSALPVKLETVKLTLDDARKKFESYYHAASDQRFTRALAEIHHILSGLPVALVDRELVDGRWRLAYRGIPVGSLSECADFGEQRQLLLDWTNKQIKATNIKIAEEASLEPSLQTDIDTLSPARLMTTVRKVDSLWKSGKCSRAHLREVARALAWLNVQSLDLMEVNDQLTAKTLATLSIVDAFNGDDIKLEWCLIADKMGYITYARRLAKELPKNDPVALSVSGRTEQLGLFARENQAPLSTKYLFARALARDCLTAQWKQFVSQSLSTQKALLLPVLSTFHEITTEQSRLPLGSSLMLATLSEVENRGNQNHDIDVGQLIWTDSMYTRSADWLTQNLQEEFEQQISQLEPMHKGQFIEGETVRNYYRSYFLSAVKLIFDSYLDLPSARAMCEHFVNALDSRDKEKPLSRWLKYRISAKQGLEHGESFQEKIPSIHELGAPALVSAFRELPRQIATSENMKERIELAKYLFAWIDSRPSHLEGLAEISDRLLYSGRLTAFFWQKSNALGSRDLLDPQFAYLTFCLRQADGDKALHVLLRNKRFRVEKQVEILQYLEKNALTSDALTREYLRLADLNSDSWFAVASCADYLMQTGKNALAASLLQKWLFSEKHSGSPYRSEARAKMALALLKDRRPNQGLVELAKGESSENLDWLTTKAMLLGATGNLAEAEVFANAAIKRYPDSPLAVATKAELDWMAKRYSKAAKMLTRHRAVLAPKAWLASGEIGKSFVRVFGSDRNSALLAASAMKDEGIVDSEVLSGLASSAFQSGHADVAFTILSLVPTSEEQQPARIVTAYMYLASAVGRREAMDWLKKQVPAEERASLAPYAFQFGANELLWDFISIVPDKEKAQLWRLRAASSTFSKSTTEAQMNALRKYFDRQNGFDVLLGRYLLDMPGKDDLLKAKLTNEQICRFAFFRSWKALHKPVDFKEDTSWFCVCLETGCSELPEFDWACTWLERIVGQIGGPMLARTNVVLTATVTENPKNDPSKPVSPNKMGYNCYYYLDKQKGTVQPTTLIPIEHFAL